MRSRDSYSPRENTLKLFFGNIHRLDVAAVIGRYSVDPPEAFSGPQIKQELLQERGLDPNTSNQQLKVLESLDMIRSCPKPRPNTSNGYDPTNYYERTDSPLWRIVEVAIQAIDEQFPES